MRTFQYLDIDNEKHGQVIDPNEPKTTLGHGKQT
jgi:hypothetical protein